MNKTITGLRIILLVLVLSSCSMSGGDTISDKIHQYQHPQEFYLMIKLKRIDYNSKAWDDVSSKRCGWSYARWVYDLTHIGPNVCMYICEDRPIFDFRNDLFDTQEDCLYYDQEVRGDNLD